MESKEGDVGQHMVQCVKFGREMPGLDEPPFDTDLGQKIYDNVSEAAWKMWQDHAKMIINEYRLNPATRQAQELLVQQLNEFFFGEGAKLPPDYVPPPAKH
jgi:Fe-S cluster biosynthesis and repair protein YggX